MTAYQLNQIYQKKSPMPQGFRLACQWSESIPDQAKDKTTIIINQTEDVRSWRPMSYCFAWLEPTA